MNTAPRTSQSADNLSTNNRKIKTAKNQHITNKLASKKIELHLLSEKLSDHNSMIKIFYLRLLPLTCQDWVGGL